MKDSSQNPQPQYVDTLQKGIDQFEIATKKQMTKNQLNTFWAHQRKHLVEHQQRLDAIRQRQQEEELRQQQRELRRQQDEEHRRLQEEERRRQEQEEEAKRRRQAEEEFRQRKEAEEFRRQQEDLRRTEEIRRQHEEELKRQQEEEARRAWEFRREEFRREETARQKQEERQNAHNKAKLDTKVGCLAQIERYHLQWTSLREASRRRDPQATPLVFQQIPWPVFDPAPKKPADISTRRIKRFISYPDRPRIELGGVTDIFKVELLRWHPDKFESILACVWEEDRDIVKEGLGIVTRTLTQMKTRAI